MKTCLTKYSLPLIPCLLTIFILSCAIPTKQPNYLDKHPNVLKKQYSADEIATIEKNFKANPSQYSQTMGDLILWRMHQKSPKFALEFAQIPEIADGVNAQDAKAMGSIYGLIKDVNIPPDFFAGKRSHYDVQKLIIQWGSGKENRDWDGIIVNTEGIQGLSGKILNVEPIEFEKGDEIHLTTSGDLTWKSITDAEDTDGIIVTLNYPLHENIMFGMNEEPLDFTIGEVLTKELVFDKDDGLKGKLIIKNALKSSIETESFIIKDMVLSGEGEYRYSSPLQALLWGYMDGKFKEGDDPLKDYKGLVEFVKPIWGEMEGKRWRDFDAVTSRLNAPGLVDHYTRQKISYEYYIGDKKTNSWVFKTKKANCADTSEWIAECLTRAGYESGTVSVYSSRPEGHRICYFKDKDKIFIIDNGKNHPIGIRGPFESFKDIPYDIKKFR